MTANIIKIYYNGLPTTDSPTNIQRKTQSHIKMNLELEKCHKFFYYFAWLISLIYYIDHDIYGVADYWLNIKCLAYIFEQAKINTSNV